MVKPNLVLTQIVEGMPVGAKQQVRVMTATFQPGERTLFHTHRRPVTVYVWPVPSRWRWRGTSR